MALVDVSITVITLIFKAFLVDSTMDVLSAYLKKGGIKDLLAFFPPNKREGKHLEEHFRKEGTPQVADWWAKKQYAVLKEEMIKDLRELSEREDTPPAEVSSPHPFTSPKSTNRPFADCRGHQGPTTSLPDSRHRARALHLARPHVLRGLERPP